MGIRHRGRELAFQILFQTDQTGDKVNAVIARFEEMKRAKPDAALFAEALAQGAFAALPEMDALVAATADNWKLSRLLSVDRAVLRLGAFELAQRVDVPAEVVLDECIELAKTYGSEESPAFVNGVLDRLARKLRPGAKIGPKPKPKAKANANANAGASALGKPTSTPIPKAKPKTKSRAKTSEAAAKAAKSKIKVSASAV